MATARTEVEQMIVLKEARPRPVRKPTLKEAAMRMLHEIANPQI